VITRYIDNNRFRNLNTLGKIMDEVFGDSSELRSGWMPAVDIKETQTEITFFVEIPGVSQEDLDVELVGEVLTIRGKRESKSEESRENFVRVERNYGTFQRSFTIGVPVKADQISATYTDGVLSVVVPKADEVQPRRISISRN
jgi:HSP20 family protein